MRTVPSSCGAIVVLIALMAASCDSGPRSGKGFALPDGTVEDGQAAFVELGCNVCHDVHGIDLPAPTSTQEVKVTLGGAVHRVRTYGELVTAIIYPSHGLARGLPREEIARDGESRMANYNSTMTVAQLIDLVAFLQSRYKLLAPDYTPYPYF